MEKQYNYNKIDILNDLLFLKNMTGRLDKLAERDYRYEDMYTDNVIDLLEFYCGKYNIEFNRNAIDWEWCDYPQSKEWELEDLLKNRLLKVI